MKASGRLLVLVQALTSPKLAAVDEAAGAIPAPLQVRPRTFLTTALRARSSMDNATLLH